MKNKFVSIFTKSGEKFMCFILEENHLFYTYKGEYGIGHIFKDDIKEIDIIGDVI